MTNFAPKRTHYQTDDNRWNRDGIEAKAHDVTVTTASFKTGAVGSDGWVKSGSLITGKGFIGSGFYIKAGEKHLVAAIHDTTVDRRYLPQQLTQAEESALKNCTFINGTAPSA